MFTAVHHLEFFLHFEGVESGPLGFGPLLGQHSKPVFAIRSSLLICNCDHGCLLMVVFIDGSESG